MNAIRLGKHVFLLITGILLASFFMGCAPATKIPIHMDSDLVDMNIEVITLLPIVDRRVDKSYDLNLEKKIGKKVEKMMGKKGYIIERPGAFSDTKDIPNDEIAEMEPRELAILGASDTEFIMVAFLDDASAKTALGYSFKCEVTAVLINKQNGNLIWKDKGIGSQGQGGLIGCLMSSAVKDEAIAACIKSMLLSFPINRQAKN